MSSGPQPPDDVDPLMSIGTFSRASLISVKALRVYHEQGLLVPDSIDPATAYRSYRVSQLTDAAVIKRLRDLDVGLADVAEVVRARDPEITREVLAGHAATMQQRLQEVGQIVDQLHQSMDLPGLQTPAHPRFEPQAHVLLVADAMVGSDYPAFLLDAFGRLSAAVESTMAAKAGPPGARYDESVDPDHGSIEVFVPIDAPVTVDSSTLATGVTLGLIPAATCAVMTHAGSYESMGETYRQLGAWVARHERTADQPVREYYVISIDPTTGEALPHDQLRTEISWPILPPDTTKSVNHKGTQT